MKHVTTYGIVALCLAFYSCNHPKVIINPQVMATNTRTIEIGRIERSDTATIFYIDAYNLSDPECWVKIVSDTYLKGNDTGVKYKLLHAQGIELDKEVEMPESGNIPFTLYFEPIDKKETAVEFVGGYDDEKDEPFVISGIQLREREVKGKIKCHIHGTVVDRPQSSRLMLMPWNSDFRVYPWTSIPIRDGKFDYTFYVDVAESYELIFFEEPYQGSWRLAEFFAEKGDIAFTLYPMERGDENEVSTQAPLNAQMKAYKENLATKRASLGFSTLTAEREVLYNEHRYYSDEFEKWVEELRKATTPEERNHLYRVQDELYKSGRAYSKEAKDIMKRMALLNAEVTSWQFDYMTNNPSLPTYHVLVSSFYSAKQRVNRDYEDLNLVPYFTLYEEVFKPKFPNHPYTYKMEEYINGNSIKEGGQYIDFIAPDAHGKEFKLSEQIAGKVALIDLWASWCGPCRYSSKSMIPVYEKYKERGFTVVGVARERSVSDMIRAAQQDGYPWLTLVELEDREKIWEKYGVGNGGGKVFLVDKTGTIVAVNPTAEQVMGIIENLL